MKALVGSWDNRPYRLLAEITALRRRVAELEHALAAADKERTTLREQNAALRSATEASESMEVVLG